MIDGAPYLGGRRIGRWLLRAGAGASLGFILTPLVFVSWLAFFRQDIPSFPPEGYTLRWFANILTQKAFVSGFVLSAEVGLIATAAGLLLGVPASLCLARFRFRGREALNTLLLLPLVVPGVVLGTTIYISHIEVEIDTGLPITASLASLVLGHILLVIPWCVRLVTASFAGVDPAIEEAAQNLGANPWTTFRRVTVPAIRPGIVAAALFGFVASFGNLEMSLFLVGPGRTTLPIAILQYLEWKIDPTIAAVSVVQILLIGAAMVVTDRYVKLGRVV
jgi:putative spermidine/putrescine transport system permease protein